VKSKLFNPFVPETFIELMAICRMPEKARSLTHLRSQGLIEGPKSTRTKLLPDSKIPVVNLTIMNFIVCMASFGKLSKDSWLRGIRSCD